MKTFDREMAAEKFGGERKEKRGVVCPDFDGGVQFNVREPSAADVLRVARTGEEYGDAGATISLLAAAVVDDENKQVLTFEQAAELVLRNPQSVQPLMDALAEVTGGKVDSGPLE